MLINLLDDEIKPEIVEISVINENKYKDKTKMIDKIINSNTDLCLHKTGKG